MQPIKYLVLIGLLILSLGASAQTVGLNGKITSAEPKQWQFVYVSLTTGTNVPVVRTNLMFTAATFYGFKQVTNNVAPTANSAAFYMCFKDPTGLVLTNSGVGALDSVAAGGSYSLAPVGVKYNASEISFVGTTGDRVLVRYQQ